MEDIFGAYFQKLVEKVDRSSLRSIQIVSKEGRIVAKGNTESLNIPSHIIRSVIQELDIKNIREIIYNTSGEYTVIAAPMVIDNQLLAVIFIEAIQLKRCEQIVSLLRTSLESYIEYYRDWQSEQLETTFEEAIIKELLAVKPDSSEPSISYSLFKSLKANGFDLFRLRSVVIVELEKKANVYFNSNLDLGYDSSAENFKDKGVQIIKANQYLNNQDIVGFVDGDHIVIVKSFLDAGQMGKLYQALDNICKSIMNDLEAAKNFSYHIAYGDIYPQFIDVRKSYLEAKNTIRLGNIFLENPGVYNTAQGLLEHVGYYLPPIIKHRAIQDALTKLTKTDGSIDLELLGVAEKFVDQCMNLMQTAERLHMHRNTVSQKITKFKKKTGLDPEKNFTDAFIIKMTAIAVKIQASGK